MKIVGLTGGIGSGKSVVANLLDVIGAPVYDSDSRSKLLCDEDPELISALKGLLGDELYSKGYLDRKMLSAIIFRDREMLDAVDRLIHPAVERDFQKWLKEVSYSPVVFQESAIIFEAGLDDKFDYILCVTAPEDIRIERVCKRSGMCAEEVRERMFNQLPESECIRRADFVVVNDGKKALIPQINSIIDYILNSSK